MVTTVTIADNVSKLICIERITKTTVRKEYQRCPMCSESARTEKEFREHIMVCAMRVFECPTCDFSSSREINLKRHVKRCHPGLRTDDELVKLGTREQDKKSGNFQVEEKRAEESADEDWLNQDPGNVIGEVSSVDSSSSSDENEDGANVQEGDQQPERTEVNPLEGRVFRKKTQPSLPFGVPCPKESCSCGCSHPG